MKNIGQMLKEIKKSILITFKGSDQFACMKYNMKYLKNNKGERLKIYD